MCEMEWLDVANKYWASAFLVCFEQHQNQDVILVEEIGRTFERSR